MTLEDDEEREVRTLLKQQDDGYVFSIASKVDPGLGYWQEHARGEIVCLETQQSKAYAIQEIEAECDQHEIVMADSEPNAQPGSVGLGARWQNCRWIKLGAEQGLAFLELPEVFADDLTLYKLHPALLGIATSFLTKQSNHDAIYLPFTFKQLKVNAPLPARFYSHIRAVKNSSLNGEAQTFNITIMDERGIGIVEIEDYILRKVSKDKTASMEANKADVASNAANLSTADARALFETADSKNQSQGDIFKDWLLPSEGIEVFSRALENPLSQVLVSAVELRDRGDQTQKLQPVVSLPEVFEETKPSDAAQLRPDLSHPYAAPKNEIEQQLITIWEGILGIKQIGIQDNFFELGGDSLVAIQVISQIRKTFQIEPPISLIFDKPRVADLAEYIERTRKIAEKLQTPDNDVHLQKREEIEL